MNMSIIKKIKKTFLVLICLVAQSPEVLSQVTTVVAHQKTDQQVQQALDLSHRAHGYVQQISDALFNPVYHGVSGQKEAIKQQIKDGTPDPYPTTSLNEKAVEATFGSGGMKLDSTIVRYIKNFYFYLEYVTKLERAAYLAALALHSNLTNDKGKPTDFFSLISSGGWNAVVSALEKKYGTGDTLLKTIQKEVMSPSWKSLEGSIKATSWHNIITTDFWKAIIVTQDDIVQSIVWQEYLKYMITRAFSHDNSLLASIKQAESNIFRYIPDIEVAYYHSDYTHLRLLAELFRVNLILTDNLRNRMLADCTAWKQYLDPTSKKAGLQNAYEVTKSYEKTPLYTYLSEAEENFEHTMLKASTNEIKITDSLAKEPFVQQRLIVIAMVKNLHALVQNIYSLNTLDATVDVLNNKLIKQPRPNFMLHDAAEDYYLLEDRASIIRSITQAAQTATQQTTKTTGGDTVKTQFMFHVHSRMDKKHLDTVIAQSFFKDMWHGIKDAGESIFHASRTLVESIASLALKAGSAIEGIFDKKAAAKLKKASATLMKMAEKDFKETYSDAQQTINDVTKVAEDVTHGYGKALGWIYGKIDGRLGKDIEGAFDAIADTAVEGIAGLAHVAVAQGAGAVRLSIGAVKIAVDVIYGGLEAGATGNWKQFANQLGTDAKDFAEDIITSILDVVTLTVKTFTDDLKNIVKFAAYMVSVLTDVFIDISKGITFLAAGLADAFGADLDPSEVAGKVGSYLEAHRRTINSVIITGLMIGTAILTDGASIPAFAMIAGQQVFQIVGSYQQDEMHAEKLKEEKQFIEDYRIFVDHNKVIANEQQKVWSNELNTKYQSEITNQERDLGFYQNYLNQTLNNYEKQMSERLGSYLAPKLEPDKRYNTVPADIGSMYGLSTGIYASFKNPYQGFSLYNKGRDTFSQEIAVFPALENNQKEAAKTTIENIPSKFWFIQQETYPLAAPTSNVEVRLRAIYVLTTYHIGVYFGGKPYDIESIKKNKVAPINAGHLAKMLVFRKIDAQKPAILGVYQHEARSRDESKNWLYQATDGKPEFQVGAWYHMKMNMSNPTTLQFKVWKEGGAEPDWQQVSVKKQPDLLTTIGVISSGASVEYQILTPIPKISIVKDAKGEPVRSKPLATEKNREVGAQLTIQKLSQPIVGDFKLLQIADKIALLKSQFIYTTQETKLIDKNNKPTNDYVLICQLREDGSVKNSSIGSSIGGLNNAGIISVITGHVYNQQGIQQSTYPNTFAVWVKEHGPLHSKLKQSIVSAQKNYLTAVMKPVTFGALKLQPTSTQEIINGQYIYTTETPQLTKNGDPIKDEQGKQLADYFTFVQHIQKSINTFNLPYSKNVIAVLSLVSGNVYDNSSPNKAIDSRYKFSDYIDRFEEPTSLRKNLKAAIETAQTAYNAPPSTKGSPGANNTNKADDGDVSKNQGAHKGTEGTGTKLITIDVSDKSLSNNQKDAGDDQECFGC